MYQELPLSSKKKKVTFTATPSDYNQVFTFTYMKIRLLQQQMVAQQGTLEPTLKNHGKWGVAEYHKGILVILQQMQMEMEQLV
jgi:hypothetical protein